MLECFLSRVRTSVCLSPGTWDLLLLLFANGFLDMYEPILYFP